MRFGISATSSIFPKNLRTRFRPINVCAICPLAQSIHRARTTGFKPCPRPKRSEVRKAIKTTLQKAAIHRDHRDRRRTTLSPRSGKERRIQSVTLARRLGSRRFRQYQAEITVFHRHSLHLTREPPDLHVFSTISASPRLRNPTVYTLNVLNLLGCRALLRSPGHPR